MKKVAILQSNYIPWKGYFDLIAAVDEFIIYDDMQYTRRDWRNRNKIKTPQGIQWLTIPVQVKGKYLQKIYETQTSDTLWAKAHWKSIEQNYCKSPHFTEIAEWLAPLYQQNIPHDLSTINAHFIKAICQYLRISTQITSSLDYSATGEKTERLVDLCLKSKATEYISGPSAKSYIVEELFSRNNIKLTWFDYNNYPLYPQLWGGFVHEVTVLDLLFNCGKDSYKYMRYVK